MMKREEIYDHQTFKDLKLNKVKPTGKRDKLIPRYQKANNKEKEIAKCKSEILQRWRRIKSRNKTRRSKKHPRLAWSTGAVGETINTQKDD
jgi:hypothetical protein